MSSKAKELGTNIALESIQSKRVLEVKVMPVTLIYKPSIVKT